jgi:hypothetical protein
MKKKETKETKNAVITFRVFQSICYGIFALGISMMFGDGSAYINLPFSTLSIMTTIFGLIGAIITGSFAKQAENW